MPLEARTQAARRKNAPRSLTYRLNRYLRQGNNHSGYSTEVDANRASIIGSINELLTMERLDTLGFQTYKSTDSGEFDFLAVKGTRAVRIEVRTVYKDKTGLKYSHSSTKVPCDFYVCVLRKVSPDASTTIFYIIPAANAGSRPREQWRERWDFLEAELSMDTRWLFHPRESRYIAAINPADFTGRHVLLGIHLFGDVEIFLEEILRRYLYVYKIRGDEFCLPQIIDELSETYIHELIHSYGFPGRRWEDQVTYLTVSMMLNMDNWAEFD